MNTLTAPERRALHALLEATEAAQWAALDAYQQDRRRITAAFLDYEISTRVARTYGIAI